MTRTFSVFARVLVMFAVLAGCTTTPTTPEPERSGGEENELLQRQMDLAVGYLRNRDYARAKEKLNRALEINPKYSPAHATYGLLFQAETAENPGITVLNIGWDNGMNIEIVGHRLTPEI